MKTKIELGARLLLGLIFLVFGSNGLLMVLTGQGFIPMPPLPPEMIVIMTGFDATIYLMPLVKSIEVLSAILLLSNRYVNLAITLLAPIVVNIIGFHVFVAPSGFPMAFVIGALTITLFYTRWENFRAILNRR